MNLEDMSRWYVLVLNFFGVNPYEGKSWRIDIPWEWYCHDLLVTGTTAVLHQSVCGSCLHVDIHMHPTVSWITAVTSIRVCALFIMCAVTINIGKWVQPILTINSIG